MSAPPEMRSCTASLARSLAAEASELADFFASPIACWAASEIAPMASAALLRIVSPALEVAAPDRVLVESLIRRASCSTVNVRAYVWFLTREEILRAHGFPRPCYAKSRAQRSSGGQRDALPRVARSERLIRVTVESHA